MGHGSAATRFAVSTVPSRTVDCRVRSQSSLAHLAMISNLRVRSNLSSLFILHLPWRERDSSPSSSSPRGRDGAQPKHTNAYHHRGPASTCLPSAPRTPRTPQRSMSPSPRTAQGQMPQGGSLRLSPQPRASWCSSSSRSTHGRASTSPRRSRANNLLHAADCASRCAPPCLAPQHPR